MYSILGFLQVLLMLTQTRLAPDLDFIWTKKQAATQRIMPFAEKKIAAPVNSIYHINRDAISVYKQEKWLRRTSWNIRPRFELSFKKNTRISTTPVADKLYLLLCQLKTEG